MASLTLGQTIRRAYHELVRRRTSVRIVPAVEVAEPGRPPIFVTGLYRSGTTLVRYVLDSHSQICCPPESHFIHHLEPLLIEENTVKGLASLGFDPAHVISRMREFGSYFFENYAASKGKPRWADKTPYYVDHLATIQRVYPEAAFLMIYRNGLDQAYSFSQNGTLLRPEFAAYCRTGEDIRIGAVRYWSEKTLKVLDFELENPDQCLRVVYKELCRDPRQLPGNPALSR